jgi:redox-sensitive bicupin YhaK (pirin superfamily)
VASGEIDIAGDTFGEGRLLVFKPATASPSSYNSVAPGAAGRRAMDSSRHIWWNFVSSSMERIKQAKEDWRGKRFALVPGTRKSLFHYRSEADRGRHPGA